MGQETSVVRSWVSFGLAGWVVLYLGLSLGPTAGAAGSPAGEPGRLPPWQEAVDSRPAERAADGEPRPQDSQDEVPPPAVPPTVGSIPRLTQDDLKAQLDAALEASLDEETKKKVQDWYKSAAERVTRWEALPARTADLQQRIATADQRAEKLREAAKLNVEPARFSLEASTLAEIQKEAADTESQLRQWKERVAALNAERDAMTERRREIVTTIAGLPDRLAELRQQLQAAAPEGESPIVTKARRAAAQTQLMLWEAELPALNLERDYLDGEMSRDILRLERDALVARIDHETRWLQQVNEAINIKREAEAQQALKQAETQRFNVPAPLQSLADEIKELAVEQAALSEQLSQKQQRRDAVSDRLRHLREQFESTQKKVRSVGLTSTIGFLLRKQRGDIPTATELQKLQLVPGEIGEVQLKLLQIDEQRGELILFDELALQLLRMDKSERAWSNDQRVLVQQAVELLQTKRESLDTLHRNLDSYFNMLVEVDTDVHQLTDLAGEYLSYIDERILWIPSSRPLLRNLDFTEMDRWLFQVEVWQQIGQLLLQDFMNQWLWWLVFLTAWFSLQLQGPHWRTAIGQLAREASSGSCSSFMPTGKTLLYTILIALPWPALLWFLGWRIESAVVASFDLLRNTLELQGIGRGFGLAGLGLLPLECLRNVCREMGLGGAHFGWSAATLKAFGRLLRLVIACGLPLVFLTTTLHWVDPVLGEDLLERACFLVGCGLLLYAAHRVLHPTRGLLRTYYARHVGGWSERLRFVWFGLGIVAPLLLAGLTVIGYYYSAYQLALRLYSMFWLVICLLVGSELVARLILVERRRVFIEQAKQRRAQAASASGPVENVDDADVGTAAAMDAQKDWQEKLAEQTKQSQNLLHSVVVMFAVVGTWLIWADVIPALRVVYQQNLWTTTEMVSEVVGEGTSTSEVSTKEVIRKITPTDLLQALIVLAMTFVIFRNLPGLIDILVLNQLPIDGSTRNAVAAVLSYLVIVVGLIWAARSVGIYWNQVQWLVTALTFGLAFGLQEIFANFVSGMIILFERPVRIGDIVTVDGVTGVVTRTRARATTIRDFDLKELIVPNKEFITGRVLNWTLSDEVTRLVLPVGVAYGTEIERASSLLLESTQRHPQVLNEPAPSVTLEAFGDNALNLVVRAYVGKLSDRLRVTGELLTTFHNLLRANQIEIPFPQRDLHIRNLPPDWSVGRRPETAPPPSADGDRKAVESRLVE
jgi:potassium-dependent mechanosensitive channel